MYRFTETVRIDRPAQAVWSMLVDFPNVPAWEDGVLEVRQTSPGAPALGTRFVARRTFGGRASLIDCRITEWEADRLVTMELVGGLVRRASVTYAVEPTGGEACDITYSTDGEMRTLLVWATPLIPVMGRRLIRGNLARLAGLLGGTATVVIPAT
jgi:carbon monoxide dehydrogenase subunit G